MQPHGDDGDGCFSTDTMKDTIKEIQTEAVSQQVALLKLRQRRADLEREIELKVSELNKAKEEQMVLEVQLRNQEMHLSQLQAQCSDEERGLSQLRGSVEGAMQACAREKELQLLHLKEYEQSMAVLSHKVMLGPQLYDKASLQEEVRALQREQHSILQELDSIHREVLTVREYLDGLVRQDNGRGECVQSSDITKALSFMVKEAGNGDAAEEANKLLEDQVTYLQKTAADMRAAVDCPNGD